ncbi:uncharacterized protein LOC141912448 [Tubulanus polymorphus]|uniref:uncharacterized protein LOC141912448 n=1 Tax=Tubulanus polymorphus TaxID=672921 RepID=UPI003DA5DE3F
MDEEEELWSDVCDILTGCEFTLMQWQILLRKLGLKSGIIKSIVKDHEKDGLKEMAHIGFRRWRVAKGGTVATCSSNLCTELRKQHLALTAEKIERFIRKRKEPVNKETSPAMPRRNSNASTSTTELLKQSMKVSDTVSEQFLLNRSDLLVRPALNHGYYHQSSSTTCCMASDPIPELCDLVNDVLCVPSKHDAGIFSHTANLPLPDAENLRWPSDVTVMQNGRVVVCDFNNDCLYVFTPVTSGETWTFVLEQTIVHAGKLREPRRVAAWADYIFVCMEGQRSILVYSFAGTFLAEIHVQFNVCCIHVKDDVLYVGGRGQVVPYLIRGPNCVELAFNVIYRLESQALSCQYMAATGNGGLMVVTGADNNSDYGKFCFWSPSVSMPSVVIDLKSPRGITIDGNSLLLLQDNKLGEQEIWRIPLDGKSGETPIWKDRVSAIADNDRHLRAETLDFVGSDLLIMTAPTRRAVIISRRVFTESNYQVPGS